MSAAPMAPRSAPRLIDVGDEQQRHDGAHEPGRIVATQVRRDAAAGDAADAAADLLDHDHEGQAEQHGPGEPVAELRADLAVGGDPARVVVRGPGDQAGPEPADHADGGGCGGRRFDGDAGQIRHPRGPPATVRRVLTGTGRTGLVPVDCGRPVFGAAWSVDGSGGRAVGPISGRVRRRSRPSADGPSAPADGQRLYRSGRGDIGSGSQSA